MCTIMLITALTLLIISIKGSVSITSFIDSSFIFGIIFNAFLSIVFSVGFEIIFLIISNLNLEISKLDFCRSINLDKLLIGFFII